MLGEMAIVTREDGRGGHVVAVDPGTKTKGAASFSGWSSLAVVGETVKGSKCILVAERTFCLVNERLGDAIVMGLPVNMDGSEGPRVQSVRAMARNLMRLRDLPIVFQDERLSTFEAEEKLIAVGVRRDKRKDIIDAHAAANILQSALDRLEMPGESKS